MQHALLDRPLTDAAAVRHNIVTLPDLLTVSARMRYSAGYDAGYVHEALGSDNLRRGGGHGFPSGRSDGARTRRLSP
jgi:hypothetical protein